METAEWLSSGAVLTYRREHTDIRYGEGSTAFTLFDL